MARSPLTCKTDVIRRRGPGRTLDAVELATLERVDWFNHRRLLEPIGNIPPAKAEAQYSEKMQKRPVAAQRPKRNGLRQTRRRSLPA